LRFPEFEGEWEKKNFDQICTIATGNKNTQDKEDEGCYPFYVRSETVEKINSYSFDGEAILTAGDGVGVGKVFHYINGKVGVHQRVYILSDFKCFGKYVYYYFASNFYDRVKRMSAKNSVDSVRRDMIAQMPISLPGFDEQYKIARFLTLLDERISTQNKIIEQYKSLIKGLSYLLFCEQKNKPFLRFPQYHKEWEKVKLKEMVSRITRRNKENRSERALTIAAQYGLVDQSSFFNKQVASVDLSNYYLLYHGEFAYNKSYSKDYPWGAVKRLDLYKKGALSTLYICFSPKDTVNSEFLVHYFETNKWYRGISEIAGEGARNHGLLNISIDDYFNTTHYLPSIEEQRKIASFFNLLCVKLDKEHNILQAFETQKRYILEHMFI